jgi:uncharacterized protein (DUF58 family)
MGFFILLIAVLSFTAGRLRNELALILIGAVFFIVLAYAMAALTFLAVLHRKRALSLSLSISPNRINAGREGEFLLSRKGGNLYFFRFPGILIRYEIGLATGDDRRVRHVFDPHVPEGTFPVQNRGAYYGHDRLTIFDALGLLRVSVPIPREEGVRLLALPAPAAEFPFPAVPAGGNDRRPEPRFLRTDNLVDHRPYIPGDDPRRINWKLYGHAGDLFVRKGEPEPHAQLGILVDTQTDPRLYTPDAGRRGVDLLCENALAVILEYSGRGSVAAVGYTGGEGLREGLPAELAAVLAYPAALPLAGPGELPSEGGDPGSRSLLILALPRTSGGAADSALDRFLTRRRKDQAIDLIFLYEGEGLDDSADLCVRLYRQRGGVHARRIRL